MRGEARQGDARRFRGESERRKQADSNQATIRSAIEAKPSFQAVHATGQSNILPHHVIAQRTGLPEFGTTG